MFRSLQMKHLQHWIEAHHQHQIQATLLADDHTPSKGRVTPAKGSCVLLFQPSNPADARIEARQAMLKIEGIDEAIRVFSVRPCSAPPLHYDLRLEH